MDFGSDSPFGFLYETDATDRKIFGDRYTPPEKWEHCKSYVVARYKKEVGGDGHDVEILETRAPARFYTIRALPSKNSIDEARPGFALGTGSSMGELAVKIAEAISEGMLDIDDDQS